MRHDTLIFDLDGTLADTVPDIAASMAHAMAAYGLAVPSPVEVRTAVGAGVTRLVERLVRDASKRKAVQSAFLEHYDRHLLDHTELYPEVASTLATLDEVAMAVVTNKPEGFSRRILEGLGIARHFRALYGGDSLPVRKPDPAALAPALAALGGTRPLLVGDSGIDVETARAAGIPCAAVTYGYHKPGELDGAQYVIDHFAELLAIVRAR